MIMLKVSITRVLISLVLIVSVSSAHADFYVPSMDEIENRKENESRCHGYVESALAYQKKNQQHQCGLSGPLWNFDKQQQFDWCMDVLRETNHAENAKRAELIQACLAQKTTAKNPQNIPQVPAACYNPDSRFRAVKTLYREYRYEKTLEEPVEGGLIRYDYNQDKKEDYVFLELHDYLAKVVVCLSDGDNYQRQLTDIEFSATGNSTEGDQYLITQNNDTLSVAISSLMHNVGSSFRLIEYRYNVKKQEFEIIENKADSTPVYYDGEPAPMPIPGTPTLK